MASANSFLQELFSTIGDRGRALLDASGLTAPAGESREDMARALLTSRGEASGVALAQRILAAYEAGGQEARLAFLRFLVEAFAPAPDAIAKAARAYLDAPDSTSLKRLTEAVDAPRLELLRRLNLAPGGTAALVAMRRDLLKLLPEHAELAPLDVDMAHLLASWFNRGFLVMRRIDWGTSAAVLEKIIAYEAVHAIKGWDDLRRRLHPADRRCFAFFHPSLADEPLIFVEVALTHAIPGSIQRLLEEDAAPRPAKAPTTAVFYSISNCQEGLRGISFGNFLIKQVVEELTQTVPSLRTFVTLSPVPGFAAWLKRARESLLLDYLDATETALLDELVTGDWTADAALEGELRPLVESLAAHYFLVAKNAHGRPVDAVARFHLGNGARLERLNAGGDRAPKGMREAHALMVNYLYELRDIERNHEAYVNDGQIAASRSVRGSLRLSEKSRAVVVAPRAAAEGELA